MALIQQYRRLLFGVAKFACGALGVTLFMWTPNSSMGFLLYGVLILLLVVLVIILFRVGQLPNKDDSD